MRHFILPLAIILATSSATAAAATLEVGPSRQFTTFSAVAGVARDGDTILVYAGTYTRGTVFTANNLTIRLAPGQAVNSARIRGPVNSKGVFNIKGDNNVIDGLRFENAVVPDGNGAGIRLDGTNLTVRNSYFYNNEMGILATPVTGKSGYLTIENSTFNLTFSRASGKIGHGIYASSGTTALTVTGSKFYRGKVGHYIKSRAPVATITGSLIDDSSGSASYLINLSEGGTATIAGNTLTKGVNASNCCVAISYGEEMYKGVTYQNAPGPVLVTDNGFTNKETSSVTFFNNRSSPANPVDVRDNRFTSAPGRITPVAGPVVALEGGVDPFEDALAALLAGRDDYVTEDRPDDWAFDEGEPPLDADDTMLAALAVPAPASLALLAFGLFAVSRRR